MNAWIAKVWNQLLKRWGGSTEESPSQLPLVKKGQGEYEQFYMTGDNESGYFYARDLTEWLQRQGTKPEDIQQKYKDITGRDLL
ncbi:hypothetical protein UFOVP997_50 [uncultured Caudovirales phage]|uniref:Uncharacterized protein n=1 Tax=uncultured Caudovirales phage TaxID=2100421 RepID=A0A6J5RZJ9_9CAUD|nr:hypothetical protein UFOVP486_21 [uncultured Caudovirales phage]CAB4170236.1 hypothetical protein UFOVP911_2 [uncultured Caudovirales phage]CAB4177421.1 hypothetical protein UFOVP997_50 [uncultured Caudovirales phage]CAB4182964.1 hypothetical protein UFOVP1088_30 [uncultured Caudovirales phage]CAB4186434.1 hypothetical protein UFOVP1149_33 [uncultured Caudovirales phage]